MPRKKKDDTSEQSSGDNNNNSVLDVNIAPEDSFVEEMNTSSESTTEPSFLLLEMAFSLWRMNKLKPLMYFIDRTFCHHRVGEKYDTKIIFEQLQLINAGKHSELVEDIISFQDVLFSEFQDWLANQNISK